MEQKSLKSNLEILYGRPYMGIMNLEVFQYNNKLIKTNFDNYNLNSSPLPLQRENPPMVHLYIIYRTKSSNLNRLFNIRINKTKKYDLMQYYHNYQDVAEFKHIKYEWEESIIIEVGFIHCHLITDNKVVDTFPVTIMDHNLYVNDKVMNPMFYKITQNKVIKTSIKNSKFGIKVKNKTSDILNYSKEEVITY